jgi:hypothetical protein
MHKAVSRIGAAALAGLGLLSLAAAPAQARPHCYFVAHHPATGALIADGKGWAIKKSWACNRAERRCNRELKRKKRKGLDRGGLAARCGKAF